VAYDFHPCSSYNGCGHDCPSGSYRYQPTVTVFAGKVQPFFGLEEIFGSGTEQFVEFSMADWFFDADDNNEQMGVGFQVRAFDDRLFVQGMVSNGNETQIANLQMDDIPGFQFGGWYDFGGDWDEKSKRWILFGNGIPDLEWHCHPTVRAGGAINMVPMDRRSLYSDAELNRVRLLPGAPGGSTVLGVLNGGGVNTGLSAAGVSPFAVDAVDEYSYDVFLAGKWHGWSLYNEWWLHNYNNFRGLKSLTPGGAATTNDTGITNPILYTSTINGVSGVSLFPRSKGVIDYGFSLQSGYFLVPRKLEVAARWSWIRGQSGDINGNGTFTTRTDIPGTPAGTSVRVVNSAFDNFHEVNEYALGVNYYFYGHDLKWQNDISWYRGGNPAQGGQSPAGFIPGVDGWMFRSQIQLQF
jgi:hypothetical protein